MAYFWRQAKQPSWARDGQYSVKTPKFLALIREAMASRSKSPTANLIENPASASAAEALPDDAEATGDSDPGTREEEAGFHGTWLKNAHKVTAQKSIVICGVPRGGTSFAASVFARLGVPFSRSRERQVGRRYEHRALRAAFTARDGGAVRRIAHEFSTEHAVWAWKLPAIYRDLGFVTDLVPNPHFVLIFKEPLSVAARKTDVSGKETLLALEQVLSAYQLMTELAEATEHPMLLISYDRAMTRMEPFLREAANFAGIRRYNFKSVRAGIRHDGVRYFDHEAEAMEGPALRAAAAAAQSGGLSSL